MDTVCDAIIAKGKRKTKNWQVEGLGEAMYVWHRSDLVAIIIPFAAATEKLTEIYVAASSAPAGGQRSWRCHPVEVGHTIKLPRAQLVCQLGPRGDLEAAAVWFTLRQVCTASGTPPKKKKRNAVRRQKRLRGEEFSMEACPCPSAKPMHTKSNHERAGDGVLKVPPRRKFQIANVGNKNERFPREILTLEACPSPC